MLCFGPSVFLERFSWFPFFPNRLYLVFFPRAEDTPFGRYPRLCVASFYCFLVRDHEARFWTCAMFGVSGRLKNDLPYTLYSGGIREACWVSRQGAMSHSVMP